MTKTQIAGFMAALAAANPDPVTELLYTTPFTLLVAVVLSAQATDASVNKATPALFAAAPGPAEMLALGIDGVGAHIKTIGLWPSKSRHVVALCDALLRLHGGEVPSDRDALEALPGVGRKTANVVLNVCFGQPTIAVDTHVFRVANRTGLAPGATPRAVEDALLARLPPPVVPNAHHWLILHGRHVCRARVPACGRCPATAWCRFPAKTDAV